VQEFLLTIASISIIIISLTFVDSCFYVDKFDELRLDKPAAFFAFCLGAEGIWLLPL